MSTPIQPVPDVILASEFPSLADRPAGTYNAKAKAWADSENAMSVRNREIVLVGHINALAAQEFAQDASAAEGYAQAAEQSASEAEGFRNSTEVIAAAVQTASGLPSLAGNGGKALLVNEAEDGVLWGYAGVIMRSARSANADLVKADLGKLIDITSGTFTQAFDPASAIGEGWYCYVRNSGSGDITLDPNGAEQIDALAGYVMYPGECRLIICDGLAFWSVVINGFKIKATQSFSFVKPPGYSAFEGRLWGGGASGGRGPNGRGGGGGGCSPFYVLADDLSDSEPVVIGAGGAARTVDNVVGVDGGNSSFAGVIAGGGVGTGSGGSSISRIVSAIGNGAATGYDTIAQNTSVAQSRTTWGGACGGFLSGASRTGGSSTMGGAGGAGVDGTSGANGGVSDFAGDGGQSHATNNGGDGQIPAGGGGATISGSRSGAGARGEMYIVGIN